jgi:EmrB/QacA subfamily drug resistance transporter
MGVPEQPDIPMPDASAGAGRAPDPSRAPNRATLIALLVAVTFFMENLDATIIATALPDMARSFGVQAVDLNVGMSAYMLALAVFIPISGWLAERFGPRPVFTAAIALFTVASVLCGLCGSLEGFVGARVLQGIGGAMMVPVGRLAVLRSTEKKDLVKAIATITWPGLVAPVLGPPVGGFIVTHASWPWIFYLNLPLGVICIGVALALLPRRHDGARRPFDLLGFLLVAGACAALMVGLEALGQGHGSGGWATATSLLGVLLAVGAILHMRRHPHPLFNLAVTRIPTLAVSLYGGSLFRLSISTLPFLLPLLFQLGFGEDAFHAGLMVLWVFAGNLLMKPFTTRTMKRWGLRRVLVVNGVIGVFATALCALLTPDVPVALIAVLLFVGGLSRSMQFTALNTIGFADVPQARMSDASTLFSMFFQLSMGLGVALGALLLRGAMAWHGNAGAAATADFQLAFLGAAVFAAFGVLDSLTLQRDAGAAVVAK